MTTLRWLSGLLRRRTLEVIGAAVSIGLAVAFIAALGAFVTETRASLTGRAAARVPVDWQVQVTPQGSAAAVRAAVSRTAHVRAVLPVRYARVPGLLSKSTTGTRTTGAAYVVSLSPGYAATVPAGLRHLLGARSGVLLQQQTAANLAAGVGSRVTVRSVGGGRHPLTVSGVVDLPAADSFFQVVGAPPGAGATAPPDNVVFVPPGRFPALTVGSQRTQQLHVLLDHRSLPRDPARAATSVTQQANRLAVNLAGQALISNNLAAALLAAREDALYAQLLFLLLGLPGIALAAVVAALVTALRGERRRREVALLRLRGATPGRLVRLVGAEALVTALIGVGLGLAGGGLAARAALGPDGRLSLVWTAAAAAAGIVLAGVTQLWPLLRSATTAGVDEVAAGTARTLSARPPWPLRLGLDVVFLSLAGLVFWLTARGKYQVVVVPEGVPVASVNYAALLAPALAWPGLALLVWRITSAVLARRTGRFARSRPGWAVELEAAVVRRRRRTIARGATGLAVALALTISTAVFTATYNEQSWLDVALTVGSDVAVNEPVGAHVPPTAAAQIGGAPGARAVEPLQHRLAYVGPDLQDLYGINPATIGRAAPLRDSFVPGSSIAAALRQLQARPDGVLLSAETLSDYQLHPGDPIRLRLQTAAASGYTPVPFHVVGQVTEFPTAPKDSFIVANASYVTRTTGSDAVGAFLVRSDSPTRTSAALRHQLPPGSQVTDIVSARSAVTTTSGLAAADLSGLARLELGFGLVLALGCSALALVLGIVERRRALVLLAALGATARQRGRFLSAEARALLVPGLVGGALTGLALAYLLVKVLTGIFDPPPTGLAIPGGYLAIIVALVVATSSAAVIGFGRLVGRAGPSQLRDL